MTKNLIIMALVLVILYLYYQKQRKEYLLDSDSSESGESEPISSTVRQLKVIPSQKKDDENRNISNIASPSETKEEKRITPTRKIENVEDCETLQEWLYFETSSFWHKIREFRVLYPEILVYGEKLIKKFKIKGMLKGGELDFSVFPNLAVVSLNIGFFNLETDLTKVNISGCRWLSYFELYGNLIELDVSNNPKLTDLFINSELFYPENKIIGLEKTSIIRLDCQGGDLLRNSRDSKFIWDVFIRKYNTAFPEMKLISVDDLTELARQVNSESIKDDEFLKKFCSERFINMEGTLKYSRLCLYWVLDNLANQILTRCLIVQTRLYSSEKDPEYEKYLIKKAEDLKCKAMNPKYPETSLYENREKLVNQAINGDQELLKRLQDLPYLNPKYKL